MKFRYLLFGLLALFLMAWIIYPPLRPRQEADYRKDTKALQSEPTVLYGFEVDSLEVVKSSFKANENLGEILSTYNVSQATIAEIGHLPRETFDVKRLQAYKPYTVLHQRDSSRTATAFIYQPNPIDYVVLDFSDSLEVVQGQHPVDTLTESLSGTISSSLYESVLEAGGDANLVVALADVYAWAIDFFGLQRGDCFKVIYTRYRVDGQDAGFGHIQTALFTHGGTELLAFAFDQGEGLEYFDEQGNSLRKTFLKAPLRYARISSRFSYSRLHPILKIRRPHLGVDYAAPRGTPVQSVGDGMIIKAGRSGGAGNMIKVKHNGNYLTAYLHLSRFAAGMRVGKEVKQGEIIGYVGSTGLSTGPHLDFRFYKNGVPVDPLKVDPPSAEPIKAEALADFLRDRDSQLAALAQVHEAGESSPVLAAQVP